MSESETAVRAIVRGRVQGVGFRQAVVHQAGALGALGWVRNEDDGTVLVHAEGSDEAVTALTAFLEEGAPGAAVEDVVTNSVKVEGHEQFAIRGVSAGPFVIEATGEGATAGFALRLQVDGAWWTWTLRREPSMVPADKRLAIGVATGSSVADGADGAASPLAVVWDSGTYEQGGRVRWPEAIERGHAVFVLHGERLRGGFALQRTRGGGTRAQWLLIKRRDEYAR